MPKWTPQQNNAITARGSNILVSAAAGSGKTAVLVERVKQLITDKANPVSVDKLLIVTFTNAAAAEMKYRISKALNECIASEPDNKHYREQLSLLPGAKICTIDAFCAELVRENFYALSIEQDFSVLDESELSLLEDTVINEVLDEFFEENEADFISLIEAFTTPNNDKPIISAIKRLLRFIYAQPFPYLWLDNAIEQYNPKTELKNSVWYRYITDRLEYLFSLTEFLINSNLDAIDFNDDNLNSKFSAVIEDDLSELKRYRNAYYTSLNTAINIRPIEFKRLPSSSKADKTITTFIKSNRDTYKKLLTEEIPSFLTVDEEAYIDDAKPLYKQLKALERLTREVDSRLMTQKRERNAYSFSDIEHFAIRLLFSDNDGRIVRSSLAEELSASFYEILVDEYQDTNEAQELLFSYLSNGSNLFTVGDIKQSIYRFRLAMPHIFAKKKKEYSNYNPDTYSQNAKIILDKNFRSSPAICSYVNYVFSSIMSEELGELDYNEEEYLNPGAEFRDNQINAAQINIIEGVKGEESDECEAALIAKTIKGKVEAGELIKDGDEYRAVRYGDFAILMRSLKSHISTYAEVLTKQGIPVICDNSTNLFENNEIRILLSMLRTIDNPMQDIPLLATLLSPFYSFTEEELAQIKINSHSSSLYTAVFNSNSDKVKAFIDDQSRLRRLSVTMSVSAFIRYIVESTGFLAYVNAMGNGEQRQQNILKLISFAQSFDNGVSVGLTAFIRYIDKIIASDKSVESASLNAGGENAVTIMSIHHSKGLEYPICILAGANRQYNKADLSDKLLLNSQLGIGIKCHNEEQLYQYKSLPYAVIKDKSTTELMSENLRVLYVAMTRAKEQFITFITCDKLESKVKRLSSMFINNAIEPYLARKINCDADLFLLTAIQHKDCEAIRSLSPNAVNIKPADFNMSVNITNSVEMNAVENQAEPVKFNSDIVSKIAEKLNYAYDRMELNSVSSKLTASSLDKAASGFEYITSSKPSFLNKSGLTPAERGTAMHTFMQYCDYENSRKCIENEIERLISIGHLTAQQGAALDIEKLNTFFKSDLAHRIFTSDAVYREIKISSFVKASELYDVEFDDNILVQGIADCVFEENGELILVDYKTDRVSCADELLNRYEKQISFYKSALTKTLGKPVKESVLYSFHLEKVCYYK